MNKKDIKKFDEMIKKAWNDNNAFCRKLKEYIGKYFEYIPELKERCKNPYWKKSACSLNQESDKENMQK